MKRTNNAGRMEENSAFVMFFFIAGPMDWVDKKEELSNPLPNPGLLKTGGREFPPDQSFE
jgi:hypothetical protein